MINTIDEIKAWVAENGYAFGKYCCMADGSYRISMYPFTSHKEIAKGEPVISAGEWMVNTKNFVVEGCSTTLGIGWREEDVDFFKTTFGVPRSERY